MTNTKKIVIIGGGFAGINLARQLTGHARYDITLVDKNNYNFFPPLIYQVATGFLEPSSISYPFRKLFKGKKNVHFRMGELLKLFPAENKILLSSGELVYDYLVLATGTETNYFGMENVRRHAIPMKTLQDAIAMRNTLLQRLEQATITKDEAERKKLTTVVVAGGGPTGIEISGMFAEMQKNIIRYEYPELAGAGGRIVLVDGASAVLSPMSEHSQRYAKETLETMGVEILLHRHVKDFAEDKVVLTDGTFIETKTLIWAAGVTASMYEGLTAESYGRGRRLIVDAFNKVQGTTNIYAIGDTCIQITDQQFPSGHPQLAQVAIQQGKNLAVNFTLMAQQKPLRPFAYHDKGSMAIIGRNKAVAELPKPVMHFKGFIAWFMWIFIHLMSLINYRNRIKTFYNWMVAYFTKDQSLRMIIRPADRDE